MNKGELVAISKSNGAMCVLIPLFTRNFSEEPLDKMGGFSFEVVTISDKPDAYIVDWEDSGEEAKTFGPGILDFLEVLGPL